MKVLTSSLTKQLPLSTLGAGAEQGINEGVDFFLDKAAAPLHTGGWRRSKASMKVLTSSLTEQLPLSTLGAGAEQGIKEGADLIIDKSLMLTSQFCNSLTYF